MPTSKNDALALPQQLAAELAALDHLLSYELRYAALHGASGTPGIRARFLSKLDALRRAHGHSDLMISNIGREIEQQCSRFLVAVMVGERFKSFPKTV
ncbi:hypothetical protein [Reyranella sp.]|uniref:hypothetical protein n=1 Tax=Reyranella sp. TaxID=1929291 RepID=UPI00378459F6